MCSARYHPGTTVTVIKNCSPKWQMKVIDAPDHLRDCSGRIGNETNAEKCPSRTAYCCDRTLLWSDRANRSRVMDLVTIHSVRRRSNRRPTQRGRKARHEPPGRQRIIGQFWTRYFSFKVLYFTRFATPEQKTFSLTVGALTVSFLRLRSIHGGV